MVGMSAIGGPDYRTEEMQLAGAALVVLFVATTLSVYKPRGLTPYGRRREHAERNRSEEAPLAETRWGRYVLVGVIALILLFIAIHLAGGGLHHH